MSLLGLIDADPKVFNAEGEGGVILYWFEEVKDLVGNPYQQVDITFESFLDDVLSNEAYRPKVAGDMTFTGYLYSRKALAEFTARMDEAKNVKRDESGDNASADTSAA